MYVYENWIYVCAAACSLCDIICNPILKSFANTCWFKCIPIVCACAFDVFFFCFFFAVARRRLFENRISHQTILMDNLGVLLKINIRRVLDRFHSIALIASNTKGCFNSISVPIILLPLSIYPEWLVDAIKWIFDIFPLQIEKLPQIKFIFRDIFSPKIPCTPTIHSPMNY